MGNPLIELTEAGQSIWLDNLTRTMIQDGRLARLVREDGLSGVTSNPTIFHKAMTSQDAYDEQIRTLADRGQSAGEIYEALAIRDIRGAADILRPVYERTERTDGFVSLEVSPHLARDTRRTVDEAERLWKAVDRPNVLIKIPGTDEGIPAIEACLARGINVNITLLFSLDAYRKVMEAYFRAMETRIGRGEAPAGVASVASFFLSRIDVKVDESLDAMAASGRHAEEARALRGRSAVASARLAYGLWKQTHAADRWKKLESAGARFQKPLWASTSTKDPTMPDVRYVEALIGPHTINTMPDETIDAFRDHGRVRPTLEADLDQERRVIDRLAAIGIPIDRVTRELVDEGIDKFVRPFDALLESLEGKRRALTRA
ncbi:MAG: transaldolase [Acidobacteriota bacterium]